MTTWQTIGFDKIKKVFENSLEKGSFAHAYIFSGQEMIGKKTFALEFAALASEVTSGANPNILFINADCSESGQSITIEEIRKAKNFISLSSYSGSYKFVIVDDAHLMTTEAQNALLKILEEPNPSSVLVLVTANPTSFLPTIVSRCQKMDFSAHSRESVSDFLKSYKLPGSEIEFLSEFVNGRLGLAKKIVEESSFGEIKNSVEELVRLTKLDLNGRLAAAQKISEDKDKTQLPRKVLYWMLYMRMRTDEPKAHKVLSGLLDLNRIISQPQFNQRLALENFLVQL